MGLAMPYGHLGLPRWPVCKNAYWRALMEEEKKPYPIVKAIAFALIAGFWVVFDQATKAMFSGQQPGGLLAGPFLGLIDIRLVHNTGGAWGILSDNTMMLGVFSVVVCLAVALFFFVSARQMSWLQTIAFSLIVAGGVGNAIDRFAQGFVTDFIEFSFIDFPVFNVADIGVTCGFALVIISMFATIRD